MKRAPDNPGSGAMRTQPLRFARLRAVAPRHLATATMLVLVALGLRSLLWPAQPPAPEPPPAAASAPSRDFALQFARAYLSYDAQRPGLRRRALAPFLGPEFDADAGFRAATGGQDVLWAHVASDQRALLGGRVITVAAAVSGEATPVYLAVVVRHDPRRGLSLGGYPAFVGAPALDSAPPAVTGPPVEEPQVEAVAARAIRNYLAGAAADLHADLSPSAVISLPTRKLRLRELSSLAWIEARDSGAVLATVRAEAQSGAAHTLTYELGIERRERPYVEFIEVIPTDG